MSKTDLSFAIGLAIKNMGINPADLNDEQIEQLQFLASDALLPEPKTDQGKLLKKEIDEEKAKGDSSEYVKSFSFGKDLNENKVKPMTILLAKLVSDNIEKYIENDHAKNEILVEDITAELIKNLNGLNYPIDYLDNFFAGIGNIVTQVKNAIKGQADARKDEIIALAVGVKHPTYDKLDSRIVSFQNLNDSIARLRKDYNFTEDDYRS